MIRTARYLAAAGIVCGLALGMVRTANAQMPPQASALIERMIANSNGVNSYTASVHADIVMHTFPFLTPSLDGTLYHKEPSRNKIIFTNGLPYMAQQFSKVYPEVESPSRWNQVYYISTEGDSGGATTLKLVPRKHGRVDHIDATIDDKTAQLVALRWNYNDGGYATLDQTYSTIDGHPFVTGQTGHFEVPHWTADLKSTFTDFKINANIPDTIFDSN
jgi:hypothetical protein